MYYAHSAMTIHRDSWQPLDRHLLRVAEMAGHFAAAFGASRAAYLAGLLHDLGKYTPAFQARLEGGKSVDHATAGAREVSALVGKAGYDKITAELIAYAIAGHHTGLPDMLANDSSQRSLAERLKKPLAPLDPIWRSEIVPQADGLWPDLKPKPHVDKQQARGYCAFQLAFLGRMIFSCLVDADYRDTETFYAEAEGWTPDRYWSHLPSLLDGLLDRFNAHMADCPADGEVNRLRREILAHVRGRAALPPGLFTLTVPTGGGKTLASLGFALDHARAYGLTRIVYAIPFTSVVDQTASVFRAVLGGENILEHHSAIEDDRPARDDRTSGRDKLRLAMEDWAAPIVVTTNVQLFESLFAARTGRCRKLHNLADSVIVLDEAQTLPLRFLRPCAAALDELARNYGTSVVLCTATQPALDARHFREDDPIGLSLEGRELAPDPRRLAQALTRVSVRFAGAMSDAALTDALAQHEQGLVIVNSRGHALSLYRMVKEAGLAGAIHLTTRQYAAHRREILAGIRERLKADQPCRVVATSLVEAGVDVDFPRVWRAEAGLDQIAQAAGRCNREGRRPVEASVVTVFKAPDNPPPREIAQLSADFARMADKHPDLLSPDALEDYFREVYWRKGDGLDGEGILGEFAIGGGKTSFAYRTVAEKFRLIESGMAPVIVARDAKAKTALSRLARDGVSPGGVARDLQSYIVQVPPKARALLIANGHVAFEREGDFGDQFAVLRTDSLYRPDVGLLWEDAGYLALENSVI